MPTRPETSHIAAYDWHAQELLLLHEVMRLVGRSIAPELVFREMLHLMSELVGLNRGRLVLADSSAAEGSSQPDTPSASIRHAYGLTRVEIERGRYAWGEGITGCVLATGQPLIVQDIDREPKFLFRAVERAQLPPETVAFLALPVLVNGRPIGVLACHRIRSRQRHLNDDLALLRVLATLAGQLLQLAQLVDEQTRRLQDRNAMLARTLETKTARYGLIGSSPPLLRALAELERVSQASVSVLLLGESGTGKELFARAVHLASGRRDKPFIKVNCAAIPEMLFESELFGHEKGAFTGAASARPGWFEQADGGTLFLDEVGELPLAMQAKLLRTLQEGTLVRLGARRETRVDVRLVAATHRDLSADVQAGLFRQDLYYRLNVIPIRLPSLRERREDIAPLTMHFLSRANQAHERNVHLTPAALDHLGQHDWPGNIRELGNLIERLVLLSETPAVSLDALGRFLGRRELASNVRNVASIPAVLSPQAPLVRDYGPASSHTTGDLQAAMQASGGNQSRAAQSLGLTVRQFSYRLRKAGLL
ncbi:MAG: sigma 54-interacting transcriptional regulator [Pseudomonadota bacterium]